MRSSTSRPSEPGAVRAFLAFDLADATRARLREEAARWTAHAPGLRLVPPANAHVTLRFLGASTPAQVEDVAVRVAPLAAACAASCARGERLEVFPTHGAPRVLVLALVLPVPLLALQQRCEGAARAAGFAPEPRPYRPHVTLGRWRRRAPRPHLPSFEPFDVPLDRLVLFRSDAGPDGVAYTPVATFALAG